MRSVLRKHIPVLSIISILFASCGFVENASVPTTVPPPTSPPSTIAFSSDPQEALNQLADLDGAVDQSRISESSCGSFALTVGPSGLRSYEWRDGSWQYMDKKFEVTFSRPYLITTRDFDGDGTREFLVNFDKSGKGSLSSMFGAILDLQDCEWDWVKILGTYGRSAQVRKLQWNDKNKTLSGTDTSSRGEFRVRVIQESANSWVADPIEPIVLVAPPSTAKAGTSSQNSNSSSGVSAVSLHCPHGELPVYCQVKWSDGIFRYLNTLAAPRGDLVYRTIWIDGSLNPWCLMLYSNGGVKSTVDLNEC